MQGRRLPQEGLREEGVGRNGEEEAEGRSICISQYVIYLEFKKKGGSVSPSLRTGALCGIWHTVGAPAVQHLAHSRCSIKVGTIAEGQRAAALRAIPHSTA